MILRGVVTALTGDVATVTTGTDDAWGVSTLLARNGTGRTVGDSVDVLVDGRRAVILATGVVAATDVPPGDVALLMAWSMPDYDYHTFTDGALDGTVSVAGYNGPITPVEDVNGLRYTINRASQHDIDTGWTCYVRARGSGTLVLRNYPEDGAYYSDWDVRATFGTLSSQWAVLSVSVAAHAAEPIVPLITSGGAFEVDQLSGIYVA